MAVREELAQRIRLEAKLTLKPPEVIGVAAVLPLEAQSPDEMVENEEIERLGMLFVMEYERRNGRVPVDVSSENLGFDVRSEGGGEVRYIEVKTRAERGGVVLTPNEWIAARRFRGKYWIYIVVNATSNPELYVIRDPASRITPLEEVEVVRYLLPEEAWKRVAERAS